MQKNSYFLNNLRCSDLNYEIIKIANQTKSPIFVKNQHDQFLNTTGPIYSAGSINKCNTELFCFTLTDAAFLINSAIRCKIKLLLWDIEWLHGNNNYMNNLYTLQHPRITVLARSPEYKDIIDQYANLNVEIYDTTKF